QPEGHFPIAAGAAEELIGGELRRVPKTLGLLQARNRDTARVERDVVGSPDHSLHFGAIFCEPRDVFVQLELTLALLLFARDPEILRCGRAHEAVAIR